MFGPLGVSFADSIRSSRTLYKWLKPVATWYSGAMRYRQYGFKYDDLLVEEREDVQRAIGRLTPREQCDRSFRFKRASQASLLHKPLPKEEWTPVEEDIRYLKPHVVDVVKENAERQKWDTMTVQKH